MLNAILVMKRDTLQETVPSGKRDTMLIFPVYIHVPKVEPSGKKGTFMGYRKSSKA